MKRKDWIINGSLALSSCLIFLLMIEVGLRVTGLQTTTPNPPKIYERSENPNISYKLKPNLKNEKAYKARVSTDKHGLRTSGESRMAILGDSITFGYGVQDEETLPAKLSALNAAVPGYQLQQQRALYEDYVQQLNPDAVMIVFYWNDLDGLKPGILDDDGILRGHGWKKSEDTRPWIQRNSAFYIAFDKLLRLKTGKQDQKEQRKKAIVEDSDSIDTAHLRTYIQDLRSFSWILPRKKYFVIWPDNGLHTQTKPMLIAGARNAGFIVIDLYEKFGNQVETLPWDTVHPSPDSIQAAAEFISEKL